MSLPVKSFRSVIVRAGFSGPDKLAQAIFREVQVLTEQVYRNKQYFGTRFTASERYAGDADWLDCSRWMITYEGRERQCKVISLFMDTDGTYILVLA